ncbi:hypothetical protein GALL_356540 [mine drainage metagenome]|uniref:HTH iclR-type domain-containing protein n=1 Tax=mine drainage metagenome TaxID=410659 RepID=A0A1J5QRP9_9ZZZZ
MNIRAPALSPLFRSDVQAQILARIFLNPDRGYTTAELARESGAPYATAHREIVRLIEAGLVTEDRVGQAKIVRANTANPIVRPLSELLRLSYGPSVVVPRVLVGIDGIDEAYIYGSWAARLEGEPGSAPGDIDVVVIGDPRRQTVEEAANSAERELGREVNIRIVSRAAWSKGTDLFVKTIKARPFVRLDLTWNRS